MGSVAWVHLPDAKARSISVLIYLEMRVGSGKHFATHRELIKVIFGQVMYTQLINHMGCIYSVTTWILRNVCHWCPQVLNSFRLGIYKMSAFFKGCGKGFAAAASYFESVCDFYLSQLHCSCLCAPIFFVLHLSQFLPLSSSAFLLFVPFTGPFLRTLIFLSLS